VNLTVPNDPTFTPISEDSDFVVFLWAISELAKTD